MLWRGDHWCLEEVDVWEVLVVVDEWVEVWQQDMALDKGWGIIRSAPVCWWVLRCSIHWWWLGLWTMVCVGTY